MIEAPEDNKIIVFNKGIWIGLKATIPAGGQDKPNSILGANLEWKKAQKNDKKKNTSDVINKIIPHRMPTETLNEWLPWKVLSRTISRHHWIIIKAKVIVPTVINFIEGKWNHSTIPRVINNAALEPRRGQGLWLTKW